MSELSPEDSEKLQSLRKALEQEFEAHSSAEVQTRKSALEDIVELKQDFLESLRHVVRHSQSDSLRAKVAMWGYEKLLEQGKATRDPLADLLGELPSSISNVKAPSNS